MIFKSTKSNICALCMLCASYTILNRNLNTNLYEVYKWMQTPGITRPARPFLCIAFARDTQQVSRLSMFELELNLFSFIIPVSITKTQSSMVIDVSAIFVLSTILRTSLLVFWNTRLCSSLERLECNGTTMNCLVFGERFLLSYNWSFKARISAKPGKNTYNINKYIKDDNALQWIKTNYLRLRFIFDKKERIHILNELIYVQTAHFLIKMHTLQ